MGTTRRMEAQAGTDGRVFVCSLCFSLALARLHAGGWREYSHATAAVPTYVRRRKSACLPDLDGEWRHTATWEAHGTTWWWRPSKDMIGRGGGSWCERRVLKLHEHTSGGATARQGDARGEQRKGDAPWAEFSIACNRPGLARCS